MHNNRHPLLKNICKFDLRDIDTYRNSITPSER